MYYLKLGQYGVYKNNHACMHRGHIIHETKKKNIREEKGPIQLNLVCSGNEEIYGNIHHAQYIVTSGLCNGIAFEVVKNLLFVHMLTRVE